MIVLLRHMTSNNSSSYLISGTCYMQYWAAYSWPFTRSESPSMIMEWWLMSVLDRIMARCGPQSTHLVSPHCFIAVATLNIRKKLAFMIWIFLLPSTHELIQNLKRIVYCQTIGNPGHHNGIRPRVHLADLEQGLVPQSRPLAYSRPSSSFSAASPQCPRRCCHSSISAGLLPLICPFYVSNRTNIIDADSWTCLQTCHWHVALHIHVFLLQNLDESDHYWPHSDSQQPDVLSEVLEQMMLHRLLQLQLLEQPGHFDVEVPVLLVDHHIRRNVHVFLHLGHCTALRI